MLILESSTMKASEESDEYWKEKNMLILNGIVKIVENGALAHYEHMLHFPQSFQKWSTPEESKAFLYVVMG